MVIVSAGAQINAEVTLESKDIGFGKAGQKAAIMLETFNFTRCGIVPASVSRLRSSQRLSLVAGLELRRQLRLHRGRYRLVVAECDGVAALPARE
jgi:hemolysin D